MSEHEEQDVIDGPAIVVLEDADGAEVEMALLAMLELNDAEFALMAPVLQLSDDCDETTLFLFHYHADEQGGAFSNIDDDDLYDEVQAFCDTLDMDAIVDAWHQG